MTEEWTEEEKNANVSVGPDGYWYRPNGEPATNREAAYEIWGQGIGQVWVSPDE